MKLTPVFCASFVLFAGASIAALAPMPAYAAPGQPSIANRNQLSQPTVKDPHAGRRSPCGLGFYRAQYCLRWAGNNKSSCLLWSYRCMQIPTNE
jgi:hypothetical protein